MVNAFYRVVEGLAEPVDNALSVFLKTPQAMKSGKPGFGSSAYRVLLPPLIGYTSLRERGAGVGGRTRKRALVPVAKEGDRRKRTASRRPRVAPKKRPAGRHPVFLGMVPRRRESGSHRRAC